MIVDIPNIGQVEFPDSMSRDEVAFAIKTKITPAHTAGVIQRFGQLTDLPIVSQGLKILKSPGTQDWTEPEKIGDARMAALQTLNDVTGQNVPEKPMTSLEGLHNTAVKAAQGLLSPTGAATLPLMEIAPLRPLIFGLLAGLGAHNAGQVAGNQLAGPTKLGFIPTPTPGLTPGQRVEGAGDIIQSLLMTLPGLIKALPKSEVSPPPPPPLTDEQQRAIVNAKGKATWESAGSPFSAPPHPFPTVEPVNPFSPFRSREPSSPTKVPVINDNLQASKLTVPAPTTKPDLSKLSMAVLKLQYQQKQNAAKLLAQSGHMQEAVDTATQGQWLREEIERRQPKEANAVPKRSTAAVPVRPPPADSGALGARVPEPEKTPISQGVPHEKENEKRPEEASTVPASSGPLQEEGVQRQGSSEPREGSKQGNERRVLMPALKNAQGGVFKGKVGQTHDELLKQFGLKATQVERGFVDEQGKWFNREAAAKVALVPTKEESGKLHSEDLMPSKTLNVRGSKGLKLRQTNALLGDLGIKQGVKGKLFKDLNEGELLDKYEEAKRAWMNVVKANHESKPGANAETLAKANAIWTELKRRFERRGVIEGSVQKRDKTGQGGFTINVPAEIWDRLNDARRKLVNTLKTSVPKEQIVRAKDAADNMARIVGQQARKGLEAQAALSFGPLRDQALKAVTAAIEAKGDVNELDRFIAIAKAANDTEGERAATFAKNNWAKLQPLVQDIEAKHQDELAQEQAAGIDVGEREGYIKHAYDLRKVPQHLLDTFLGTSQGSGQRGFTKGRSFDTLYDAIAAGYGKAIKSWNAANLVESRLTAGQQMVNDVKWLEGMKGLKDPTTKLPIVTDLVKKPDGRRSPPAGYEVWSPFHGVAFAVHRGYKNILDSVTSLSKLRAGEIKGIPVGKLLMQTASGIKHSLLLVDSYHAMRMFAKGWSLGAVGYGKGLSLVEYADKDLDNALKAGEINQQEYDFAKAERPEFEKLLRAGLNVGRIAENLDAEFVQRMPIAGTFNKWVFEKLTRGVMVESAIRESKRLQAQGMSESKAIVQAAKQTNIYFGNLGRQSLFGKSKTFQDISRLLFLAPQWVESMARTELGTIAGAPRALVTGKPDTLVKGTAGLLTAMFIATQIANLATTGKPTWDNEDGHQTDAWIPGGANGFYISPFSLPMELTHDVIRYTEAGKTPLQTASQIFANKEAPLLRAASVLLSGRDYRGTQLSDIGRVEAAAKSLIPVPLPLQAYAMPSYPGQAERQLLASAGIKAEPASSPKTIIGNLRRQFLYKIGKAQQPDFTPSEYQPLVQALQTGDEATAKKLYDSLLAVHVQRHTDDTDPQREAQMDLQKFFERYAKSHGNASKEQEEAFVKTLTPHQQDLYKKVQDQQQAVSDAFFDKLQPKLRKASSLGHFHW